MIRTITQVYTGTLLKNSSIILYFSASKYRLPVDEIYFFDSQEKYSLEKYVLKK